MSLTWEENFDGVLSPRWNGLPCAWYHCIKCGFLHQLGARLGNDRAGGRAIEHRCPNGSRELGGMRTELAYLERPARVLQDALRALHA